MMHISLSHIDPTLFNTQLLEILDAPLPFFVGVPTVSLQLVDKSTLSEIVVVDLDDVSSFTEYDAR